MPGDRPIVEDRDVGAQAIKGATDKHMSSARVFLNQVACIGTSLR